MPFNDPLPGFFGYQPSDPGFAPWMLGPQLDPWSRDWATRVLMGEVGNVQAHPGEAQGVASVIKRRSSESGASPGEVVLAPSQFEPVQTRGVELAGYDPQSQQYKDAARVIDNAFFSKGTGPFTNFYSPGALAARGQAMPAWGGNNLLDRQVFGAGAFPTPPKLQEGLRFPTPPGPAAPLSPQSVVAAGPSYDTQLTPEEEKQFQAWKAKYAPNDTGADYDLRGAFKAGLTPEANGHFSDRFKKPNHPTFSVESQYAVGDNLAKAGHWDGDKYIPATGFMPTQAMPPGTSVAEMPSALPTPAGIAAVAANARPTALTQIPVIPPFNLLTQSRGVNAGLQQLIDALGGQTSTAKASDQQKMTLEEQQKTQSFDHAKALLNSGLDPQSIAQQTGWLPVGDYWKYVGPGSVP